ncbi:MAG: hypothetical protein ACRDYA_02220 [Egibacteraceae bacterium]
MKPDSDQRLSRPCRVGECDEAVPPELLMMSCVTRLGVADTPVNDAAFGRPGSGRGDGKGVFGIG